MSENLPEQQSEPNSRQLARSYRRLTVILLGSSFFMLVCAGCCMLLTQLFGPKMIDGAEGAANIAGRITDWTLPAGFVGKLGLVIDYPMMLKFDVAKFLQEKGRGQLTVAQLQAPAKAFSGPKSGVRQMVDRLSPDLKSLKVTQTRVEKTTIRNQPAEFVIESGEDLASTTHLVQVTGTFSGKRQDADGKHDDALIILQFEAGILSDQEIDQFIQSIK